MTTTSKREGAGQPAPLPFTDTTHAEEVWTLPGYRPCPICLSPRQLANYWYEEPHYRASIYLTLAVCTKPECGHREAAI